MHDPTITPRPGLRSPQMHRAKRAIVIRTMPLDLGDLSVRMSSFEIKTVMFETADAWRHPGLRRYQNHVHSKAGIDP